MSAQEVSTEVILSEEELLDALTNGEIDYETFLLLYDLLVNGVDSTQKYLLDQIPAGGSSRADQQRGFVAGYRARAGKRIMARYQFGGELKDSGRTKYRFSSAYQVSQQWSVDFGAAREYSGNERVMRRSLAYKAISSEWLRQATFGSFRTRFGLGSIIGYRGKLFDYSDRIDGESFLFPDFGGFNGVLLEGGFQNISLTTIGSFQRDSSHSLTTVAVNGKGTSVPFHPSVIAAVHTVENRTTGTTAQVYQAGVNLSQKWKPGSIEWELSGQSGAENSAAMVIALENKWRQFDLIVNGWSYGEKYLGLAAGSRAASLSTTEEIESVDFTFSDRRAGQTGGRVQGEWEVASVNSISGDLLFATRGKDTSTVQTLWGIERQLDNQNQVRLDFLYKATEKSGTPENIRRRGRAEWKMSQRDFRGRVAVGYTDETTYGQYWSLLVQVAGGRENSERWQVWSNWRRVAHGRIDSWHGFVSLSEQLADGLRGAIKFTDSYNSSDVPRHSPSLTLELLVQL